MAERTGKSHGAVKSVWNTELSDIFIRKPPKRELAAFCRKFAFLWDSGLDIERIVRQISANTRNRPIRKALEASCERMLTGVSMADAFGEQGVFPEILVSMCRIGELGGSFSRCMSLMAEYFEKEADTGENLISVMIYPIVVAVMMSAVMVLSVLFVLPNFMEVFIAENIELPAPTRALLSVSGFIGANYRVLIAFAVLFAAFLAFFFRTRVGRITKGFVAVGMPVFGGLNRTAVNLQIARSMWLMLDAGRLLPEVVATLAEITGNKYVAGGLAKMRAGMEQGSQLGELMGGYKYYEPGFTEMVKVGEETGMLTEAVRKCAEYLQAESEIKTSRAGKLLEPAVTVLLGVFLGMLILAVIMPTFALVGSL